MINDEKILLKNTSQGDIEAFEQLVESCAKKVYNIAYRLMGNYDDANDMAQEAFIKMYKNIHKFKGESSFSTWAYRVVTNTCLDELRKRKRHRFVSADVNDENGLARMAHSQIADIGNSPEDVFEKKQIAQQISSSLDVLKSKQKSIIVLRDIEGLSYKEIANILRIPEGSVKSSLNRARAALRNILKSKGVELFDLNYVKQNEGRVNDEKLQQH